GGADQPFQADRPQPHLEHDDAGPDGHTRCRGVVGAQTEGMEDVAGNSNDKHKKRTNDYQVHRGTSSIEPLCPACSPSAQADCDSSSARTVPYCSSRSV